MSNKYLEKIAQDNKDKQDGVLKRTGKAILSNVATDTAATIAAAPISMSSSRKLLRSLNDKGNADMGTIKKFMRDNNLHKTTTFNLRDHNMHRANINASFARAAGAAGPVYGHTMTRGANKNFISGVRLGGRVVNPDVIMHELGHAKDFASHGKIKHVLSDIGRSNLGKSTAAVATAAALTNEKTRDYAPAVAAIPGAIVLREEGAANYHAYKGIKAHKGAKAANRFLRGPVLKNMGSYAPIAAAPVAGAYLAKKIMDKWSPRKKDGK